MIVIVDFGIFLICAKCYFWINGKGKKIRRKDIIFFSFFKWNNDGKYFKHFIILWRWNDEKFMAEIVQILTTISIENDENVLEWKTQYLNIFSGYLYKETIYLKRTRVWKDWRISLETSFKGSLHSKGTWFKSWQPFFLHRI